MSVISFSPQSSTTVVPLHSPGNWLKEGDLPKASLPPKWVPWASVLEEEKHTCLLAGKSTALQQLTVQLMEQGAELLQRALREASGTVRIGWAT